MRLIDADAFSVFLKDAVIRQKYDRLNIDNTLTAADVLQSVCAELDGTGLEGFKNAPTVDAVPVVHGRWVTDGMMMDCGEYLMTRCTACGTPFEYGYDMPYCPQCGAKMDGKDDDHEKAN